MTMKVALDAQEFLDRIEEQLAWIAVAGSCAHEYEAHSRAYVDRQGCAFFANHFQNAVPWVSFGGEDDGVLDFSDGLGVEVAGPLPTLDRLSRDEMGRLLHNLMSTLRRPLRQAVVREGGSFTGRKESSYLLSSVAMLPPRDNVRSGPTRGMRRLWFQNIELCSTAAPSKRSVDVSSAALRHDGLRLLGERDGKPDDEWLRWVTIAATNQNVAQEQWLVELSMSPDRTGLAITTDAVGARDFVTSLGRGGSRRALVHWVKAHHRRRRGSGDPSLVRAHLRGTQFAIAGHLYATIRPSIVDIDIACNGARFETAARPGGAPR